MTAPMIVLIVFAVLVLAQARITRNIASERRKHQADLTARLDEIAAALVVWSARLSPETLGLLLDARLVCVRCAAEQLRDGVDGVNDPPAAGVAYAIVDGDSVCKAHAAAVIGP